ncbi:hypothetical protein XENOCAPTIV_018849 [Xenoophorus captivus]|uniref:C2H2-type domain-containing protein n=1 Tax=Xenoophorus captivus TaxID=1517983 RepID=A0ABV0QAK5_9TELE
MLKKMPLKNSPDMDQQELQLLHIKEGNERIWANQDQKQLNVKEETDYTRFPVTVVHMKSEEDEEKPLFSQLHQHLTEDRDLPRSISTDQIKAEIKEEDCGTAETSINPDLNTHGGSSNYSLTKDGKDDEEDDDVKHHESELKHLSDSETEDSEEDWKESRAPGSGRNAVHKSLSCSECGGKFANRRSLHSHITCHPRLSSDCSINETCFREKNIIDSLTNVQKGSKTFNCGECGQGFIRKYNLKQHTKVHTGEKPFSCDVCGKRFCYKSELNMHMRIHTGDKLFSCDACGKRFVFMSQLNTHVRIHTGDKPFACDVCGKGFVRKSTLDKHMRIHTGDQPFGCDACGKRFCYKSELNIHMRIHTGD